MASLDISLNSLLAKYTDKSSVNGVLPYFFLQNEKKMLPSGLDQRLVSGRGRDNPYWVDAYG